MLNAALFGAIAAGQSSAPPVAPLPEDEPLPAATATLNATTANFSSVYAGAVAGNHIVLANGNYGGRTLNRSFPTNNRLVIRSQNLQGAIFTGLTISGSGQIVSGVDINRGQTTGNVMTVQGSNVRVTRSKIRGGGYCVVADGGVTDLLVDHCEVHRSTDRMFYLRDPADQQRITVARCWVHELLGGGDATSCLGFAWTDENAYREKHHDIIVRFNYCGPGLAPAAGSTLGLYTSQGIRRDLCLQSL